MPEHTFRDVLLGTCFKIIFEKGYFLETSLKTNRINKHKLKSVVSRTYSVLDTIFLKIKRQKVGKSMEEFKVQFNNIIKSKQIVLN